MSVHTGRGKQLRARISARQLRLDRDGKRHEAHLSVRDGDAPEQPVPPPDVVPSHARHAWLGDQDMTSAIGKACHGMMMMHLAAWGSTFREPLPTVKNWPTPSAIHFENQVKYDKKGLVGKRRVLDDGKGPGTTGRWTDAAEGRPHPEDRGKLRPHGSEPRHQPWHRLPELAVLFQSSSTRASST